MAGGGGGHNVPLVTLLFLKLEGQNFVTGGIFMCFFKMALVFKFRAWQYGRPFNFAVF